MNGKIVTITRQFGSGGREIGKVLAEDMDVPFFDRDVIDAIALEDGNWGKSIITKMEMEEHNDFWHNLSAVLGTGGSIDKLSFNKKVFMAHEAAVLKIAAQGPCVICGRCSDYILRNMEGVTNIFIYAEMEDRIRRVIKKYGVPEKDARATILILDKARENYYNYHTGQKWGEAVNYHLSVDSGYISEKNMVQFIEDYVDLRLYSR